MDEGWLQEKSLTERVRLLIVFRLLVVTLLLGTALLIELKFGGGADGLLDSTDRRLFFLSGIIIVTYLLSLIYLLFFRFNQEIKLNIYFQACCDTITVTALVHFTGGIESVYSLFYILIIIYSVMFLARRGGMLIASASSISYGLLFVGEYYLTILPLSSFLSSDYKYTTAFLMMRIFVHMLSFYLVALVASYLVERERKVSSLLEERESAFEQLDLLHRSIIESVEAGIITVTLTGKIKLFNRAAAMITGFPRREVINRPIDYLFPGYQSFRQGLLTPARGERRTRGELSFQKKDLSHLTLGISISSLRNTKGLKIGEILIFQDMTSIKMMEEALEKNRRLAFTGEMASALAHEIRTPLAAISGSIQLLKKSYFHSKKDIKLMEIVLQGKQQIEGFMRDFLLLARPAPEMDEIVNINDLVADVLESLRLTPDWPKQCQVELRLEEGLKLMAKRIEIRQILWNLILNALQAMPEGGRLLVMSSILNIDTAGSFWELKVGDSGVGIEEKNIDLVLQPFYTTKERGTGLGLAIVNRIVAGYSGKIRIESSFGQGTTFVVVLPFVEPPAKDFTGNSRREI